MKKIRGKDLRKTIDYKEKYPCYVCGKHKRIIEMHHLIELKDCALYMNMRIADLIEVPLIPLCPNHHMYFHMFINSPDKVLNALNNDEFQKFIDLNTQRLEVLKKALSRSGYSEN